MPLLLLALLVTEILSFAYPLLAYFLWREWEQFNGTAADEYADRCLYGAIALALFLLLGRFLFKSLLSKRRPGADEPHLFDAHRRDAVRRPDGSIINIEYYGREEAQPIIFVHGLNANSKNWYYQRKYFEKDFRLIMIDLPGMGKSTRPANNDFSLKNLAACLRAVIEHTGTKNPILWGHSLGGMCILTLLAENKGANALPIKGAILQHTTYTNPVRTMLFGRLMTAIQKPVLTPLCYLITALSPILWIGRWMSYLNGTAHMVTRWLTFAGTQTARQLDFCTLLSTRTPPAVMARGCLGMFRYDVTNELPHISVPTLLIAADRDRLTIPDASRYMKGHIPRAEMFSVSPANHQGLIEQYPDVNESVEIFIKKIS